MPELPEVESVRRTLQPLIQDQTIQAMRIDSPKLRWDIAPMLPQWVSGQRVTQVQRRAKYLLLVLETGTLVIHLGMTGRLLSIQPGTPRILHDHFDLEFAGTLLRYHDPRRFGFVEWHPGPPDTYPRLQQVGPEPTESALDIHALLQTLQKRRRAIKVVLLDSHVVAGIGNIYASEILHRARIHPWTLAHTLSLAKVRTLRREIIDVMQEAIAAGGSTLKDYVDAHGRTGSYQAAHRVYGRAQQPCLRCRTPILSAMQGGRSTFWCPRCQKGPAP